MYGVIKIQRPIEVDEKILTTNYLFCSVYFVCLKLFKE